MRSYFWPLLGIVVSGCVASGDGTTPSTASTQPAERQGPQVVKREAVDWGPLNSLAAIQLASLSFSDDASTNSAGSARLLVFPQQEFITLPMEDSGNCRFRGQLQNFSFVASPGAEVSDQVTCTARGIFRYRVSVSYTTTTTFAADTLTIDAKARIHTEWYSDDDRIVDREDVAKELHGSIRITGTNCHVIAWRDVSSGNKQYRQEPSKHIRKTHEATASTTCRVERAGS
ncbi:MAG: hypothetical protein J0J01_13340 [Reyranella sp.]|uniref:hypothetical protein n=1 Tax=Reyranella sp. TaxID=1929291 RepID=UPI001AC23BF7|nr:hypothetical protein [Reyranella sp.]MBN9087889.1 hypothetical protein [Reyranella sp.]